MTCTAWRFTPGSAPNQRADPRRCGRAAQPLVHPLRGGEVTAMRHERQHPQSGKDEPGNRQPPPAAAALGLAQRDDAADDAEHDYADQAKDKGHDCPPVGLGRRRRIRVGVGRVDGVAGRDGRGQVPGSCSPAIALLVAAARDRPGAGLAWTLVGELLVIGRPNVQCASRRRPRARPSLGFARLTQVMAIPSTTGHAHHRFTSAVAIADGRRQPRRRGRRRSTAGRGQ